MSVIPFVFFTILFFVFKKKNGFDISCLMALIFAVSGFFGIFLQMNPQTEYSKYDISIIPALLYCILIGLCIYPFYKYNSNKKRQLVHIKNEKVLDIVVYVYFICFVVTFLILSSRIYAALTGDLGMIRNLGYAGEGEENVIEAYSGLSRFLLVLAAFIGSTGYFMIFVFFYSMLTLKKSTFYNVMIILGSLTPVVMSIPAADRSHTTYWLLIFVMAIIFFKQYFWKKTKRKLFIVVSVLGGLGFTYILLVTVSRFGAIQSSNAGGGLSLMKYLGSSYLNFCHIWNNIYEDHHVIRRTLPLTYQLFGNILPTDSHPDYVLYCEVKYGIFIGVFFSFIGLFLVDLGHFAAIILPLILFWIFSSIVNKNAGKTHVTIYNNFCILIPALIPTCGLFSYIFANKLYTIGIIAMLYLTKQMTKNPKR